MANPRPTVSDDFSEQYQNPQSRFAKQAEADSRGIRNVQIVRSAIAEEERQQVIRYENNQRQLEGMQNSVPYNAGRQVGRMKALVTTNLARVRATPIVTEIAIWYWPYYLFFEIILAVFGTLSFGVAAWLYSYLGDNAAAALAESWTGVSAQAFFVIFLGLSGVIFFFRCCIIFISTIQFKVVFIHPWFGSGAGSKIGTLMLTLIGSFIPLLQIFPVFWLWIIAVLWHPK